MAIDLFPTSSSPQPTKHYSGILRGKKVINTQDLVESEEFCTCITQCIPCLPMFTDKIGTDSRKNDFYSIFQNSVSGGSHEVYIVVNGQVQAEITDGTYGQIFNLTSCFGYRYDAKKIYDNHGFCEWYGYQINKDSLGNIVATETTPCFKIEYFTEKAANRTVRIETQQKGKLLHGKDYSNLTPVAPGKKLPYWRQQIRLPGALILTGMPVENDGVVMNDSIRSRRQILDKMTFEYDLELDLVSADQVLFNVILDYLFSGPVFVTDYNVYNWGTYNNVRLVRTGHSFNASIAKRRSITVKMVREEDNIEKWNDEA